MTSQATLIFNKKGEVVERLQDANGIQIGTVNETPILDTRQSEIAFVGGHKESLSVNVNPQNVTIRRTRKVQIQK